MSFCHLLCYAFLGLQLLGAFSTSASPTLNRGSPIFPTIFLIRKLPPSSIITTPQPLLIMHAPLMYHGKKIGGPLTRGWGEFTIMIRTISISLIQMTHGRCVLSHSWSAYEPPEFLELPQRQATPLILNTWHNLSFVQ